ncbi:F-box/kelch-repeat protein At3g06240-like [Chenopodium quinoa]|uniref:F-box/kelch-repeat protein At3g06240-like n=1 Tax=Chenopodium quinoa TaxID=63459 RepID=UPI000B770EBB|nr:F-box/kelch-repeat protein At3g06240-like [Chenopodium quinoa]
MNDVKEPKFEASSFVGLTDVLIHEILFRLPLKSLGILKCVCKKLNTLISDPEFTIPLLELLKSTTPPLTIAMLQYNTIASLNFTSYTDINEGVSLTPWDRQFGNNAIFESCYYFIIGSCYGLLCLYIKEGKRGEDMMYIWNPFFRKSKRIALPFGGNSTYVHVDSCWFGFVQSLNDYRIVLVSTVCKPYCGKRMHLYSLRFDHWRVMCVSDEDVSFISGSNSVFMNEALHYLVHRECILKFDLDTETVERIPFSIVPKLFPRVDQVLLGVIGEYDCLCVVFVHYSMKDFEEEDSRGNCENVEWMLELWMLEEYDNWNSWKKLYRIDLREEIATRCTQFLGLTYNGIICIQAVADGLVVVNPRCNPPSHIFVREAGAEVFKLTDYVESLVLPLNPLPLDKDVDNDDDSDDVDFLYYGDEDDDDDD